MGLSEGAHLQHSRDAPGRGLARPTPLQLSRTNSSQIHDPPILILYHTHRLDALPPTLFEGYVKDLRELYTRSGVVIDEIFSQRYMFRRLEREQERATRENHDLRMQLSEERRERLDLADRVARMERRHESREE
ncbi:hypothetical protein Tco_1384651 [Tanacetum coccineum]